jgi:hypothetical protein
VRAATGRVPVVTEGVHSADTVGGAEPGIDPSFSLTFPRLRHHSKPAPFSIPFRKFNLTKSAAGRSDMAFGVYMLRLARCRRRAANASPPSPVSANTEGSGTVVY